MEYTHSNIGYNHHSDMCLFVHHIQHARPYKDANDASTSTDANCYNVFMPTGSGACCTGKNDRHMNLSDKSYN